MVWAILDTYDYEPVEVIRETKAAVFYKFWNRDHTQYQERRSMSVLPWRGCEVDARLISQRLASAQAERNRRVNAANEWFLKRKKQLTAASGMEARQGGDANAAPSRSGRLGLKRSTEPCAALTPTTEQGSTEPTNGDEG